MHTQGGTLTKAGPRQAIGLSNYYMDVAAPKAGGRGARIWMLDSGGRGCDWVYAGS